MFVLELTYTAPLDRVDAALQDHVTWLERAYAAGHFIASGRKNPRDGGVIIAAGSDRATVEELAADDPFVRAGVCEYRITEFTATKTAPALAEYREQLPS
ncbi:YciI family protein [Streptomyces noursei]|uniref:YciI family protein n=1 Tax=Streptomyces noursei TaxID=1971 RepID=UPI0023B83A4E|nr:YciI family protein [Streptomyces noursei]